MWSAADPAEGGGRTTRPRSAAGGRQRRQSQTDLGITVAQGHRGPAPRAQTAGRAWTRAVQHRDRLKRETQQQRGTLPRPRNAEARATPASSFRPTASNRPRLSEAEPFKPLPCRHPGKRTPSLPERRALAVPPGKAIELNVIIDIK